MINRKRTGAVAAIAIVMALLLASCGSMFQDEKAKSAGDGIKDQQKSIAISQDRQNKTQPIPSYSYSEIRQVLLDVQEIQAKGAASTSVGYLEGVGIVWWCPSRGVPVSDGFQLTPTKQWVDLPGDKTREWKEVDQGESPGYYNTGTSSGTYVLCLDDNGKPFLKYWEGYIDNTVAVIDGLPADKRVKPSEMTYVFKDNKPKTGN